MNVLSNDRNKVQKTMKKASYREATRSTSHRKESNVSPPKKLTLLCLVRLAPISRRFFVASRTFRGGVPSPSGHSPRAEGAEGLTPPAVPQRCTRAATLPIGPSTSPFKSRNVPPLHDNPLTLRWQSLPFLLPPPPPLTSVLLSSRLLLVPLSQTLQPLSTPLPPSTASSSNPVVSSSATPGRFSPVTFDERASTSE